MKTISAVVLLLGTRLVGCAEVMTAQECQQMCASSGERVPKYEVTVNASKCTCAIQGTADE